MTVWDCVQIHAPKDSREPEKILIFTPAPACPFKNTNCKLIFSFMNKWGQLKFCRCKTVLTISNIRTITPERKSTLHSLKRNKYPLLRKSARYCEIFHITCCWIKLCWNFPWYNHLMSIPWILYIGILWFPIAFHLNMRWNSNILPAFTIIFRHFKTFGRVLIIGRISKFPHSIKALFILFKLLCHITCICIILMIRMC